MAGPQSGCRPLGIVQLGTPNDGSEAAGLAGMFPTSEATKVLGDAADMAAFNAAYPNAAGLPIYRIAGSYFPMAARAYLSDHPMPALAAILATVTGVNGTAANDSVVTVAACVAVRPGWRGCATFKAVHADSAGSAPTAATPGASFRTARARRAGPRSTRIMRRMIADVRAVERE